MTTPIMSTSFDTSLSRNVLIKLPLQWQVGWHQEPAKTPTISWWSGTILLRFRKQVHQIVSSMIAPLWSKLLWSRPSNDPINHIYPVENSFWCWCVSLCRWQSLLAKRSMSPSLFFFVSFFWQRRAVAGAHSLIISTPTIEFGELRSSVMRLGRGLSGPLIALKHSITIQIIYHVILI